jgi:hypothetical protein
LFLEQPAKEAKHQTRLAFLDSKQLVGASWPRMHACMARNAGKFEMELALQRACILFSFSKVLKF